jgi:hypothetical protein
VKIEIRPLSEIFPFENNARKIPQLAIDKVARPWQSAAFAAADHGRQTGRNCGDVRRLGALQLGWTEAPVHVADNLTPAQIREYRLMDKPLV